MYSLELTFSFSALILFYNEAMEPISNKCVYPSDFIRYRNASPEQKCQPQATFIFAQLYPLPMMSSLSLPRHGKQNMTDVTDTFM